VRYPRHKRLTLGLPSEIWVPESPRSSVVPHLLVPLAPGITGAVFESSHKYESPRVTGYCAGILFGNEEFAGICQRGRNEYSDVYREALPDLLTVLAVLHYMAAEHAPNTSEGNAITLRGNTQTDKETA
jgi:hypothetical protein